MCCYQIYFFFFSSRRRHTRSDRDWSSDVCSSDLIGVARREMEKHSAACPKRPSVCEYCSNTVPLDRLKDHMQETCPQTPITCVCNKSVRRHYMETHKSSDRSEEHTSELQSRSDLV